jgi:hypothetical protein
VPDARAVTRSQRRSLPDPSLRSAAAPGPSRAPRSG